LLTSSLSVATVTTLATTLLPSAMPIAIVLRLLTTTSLYKVGIELLKN
jgi:hypothetical protein